MSSYETASTGGGGGLLVIGAILTAPLWLPTALTIAAVGATGAATVGAGYLAVKGTSAAIKAHQRAEANRKIREEEQRQHQAEIQRRQAEQEQDSNFG